MKRNKRKVFCLLGVDGSGKTTIAEILLKNLIRDNYPCRYLHLEFLLLQLIPAPLRCMANRPLLNSSPHTISQTKQPQTPKPEVKMKGLLSWSILTLYLIDSLASYLVRVKLDLNKPIVIYDRYYYDYVVLHLDSCPRWLWWCYRRLIPRPDRVFLLDVIPEMAEKRDGEHSPDYYRKQIADYKEFARRINLNITIIENTHKSKDEVAALIYSNIRQPIEGKKDAAQ